MVKATGNWELLKNKAKLKQACDKRKEQMIKNIAISFAASKNIETMKGKAN